jgi:hypothetical protein
MKEKRAVVHIVRLNTDRKYIMKLIISSIFAFLTAFALCSCESDESDGLKAAKEYCKCLSDNNYKKDYFFAVAVCEGEILKKYHYYRVFQIDMSRPHYYQVSDEARDSAKIFIDDFFSYRNEHNCR